MPTLKVHVKKNPNGHWDQLFLTFGEHEAKIRVLSTSPVALRFQIDAPKEIKIRAK